jgi:hypothetical protein
MRSSIVRKIAALAFTTITIGVTTASVAGPASAAADADCGSSFCVNYKVVGDLDYVELSMSGAFQGQAAVAIEQLRLCDEKSDQLVARSAITVAERRQTDGAVRYRSFDYASQGPGAGCGTINPHDQSSAGWYQWAIRADYTYDDFGVGKAAATWYHTAWVYNKYLEGWCPTCKQAK